jgi:hypothetical protein
LWKKANAWSAAPMTVRGSPQAGLPGGADEDGTPGKSRVEAGESVSPRFPGEPDDDHHEEDDQRDNEQGVHELGSGSAALMPSTPATENPGAGPNRGGKGVLP